MPTQKTAVCICSALVLCVAASCFSDTQSETGPGGPASTGTSTDSDASTAGATSVGSSSGPTTTSGATTDGDPSSLDGSGATTGAQLAWEPQLEWTRTFDAEEGALEQVKALEPYDNGVYVAGTRSAGATTGPDAWAASVLADGTLEWDAFYTGVDETRAQGYRALTFADDILYAGGFESLGSPDVERILVGIGLEGVDSDLFPALPPFGDGMGFDTYRALVVDDDGTLLAAGTVSPNENDVTDRDIWVARIDPSDGAARWETTFGEPGRRDEAFGIALDRRTGDFLATGMLEGDDGAPVGWITAFRGNGAPTWTRLVAEREGGSLADGVAYDGGWLVIGDRQESRRGFDVHVRSYGGSGGLRWETSLGGPSDDDGAAVAVDANGDIFACGHVHQDGSDDVFIAKLTPAGDLLGEFTFDGPEGGDDRLDDCAVAPDGGLFFGGNSERAGRTEALVGRLSEG